MGYFGKGMLKLRITEEITQSDEGFNVFFRSPTLLGHCYLFGYELIYWPEGDIVVSEKLNIINVMFVKLIYDLKITKLNYQPHFI